MSMPQHSTPIAAGVGARRDVTNRSARRKSATTQAPQRAREACSFARCSVSTPTRKTRSGHHRSSSAAPCVPSRRENSRHAAAGPSAGTRNVSPFASSCRDAVRRHSCNSLVRTSGPSLLSLLPPLGEEGHTSVPYVDVSVTMMCDDGASSSTSSPSVCRCCASNGRMTTSNLRCLRLTLASPLMTMSQSFLPTVYASPPMSQ
ncbi:hypothetical protein DQ04_17201010 [Trypanosoma grayi]|uniref:hypothetical protein n=1 Tax=Trypanosoma grayi TaxID=71804 RepID=UPI0004F493E7|nr:hypothetical protein DQ04_17201010 [Trypanosoma grayi]KEG05933.1 hypothetical protein DQ04_17201010 [Trypanosoma grayi]